MLTLAWVEQQIEELRNGENALHVARDYALLCVAREYLQAEKAAQASDKQHQTKDRGRVVLTDYCANLNTVPTVQQIEEAIQAAGENGVEEGEKKSLRDARTWSQILRG